MSPKEIGYRIKETTRKKLEKLFTRDYSPKILLSDEKICSYLERDNKDKISSFLLKNKIWNENKAKELLAHKFSFFSFKKKFLGNRINWHLDYKNGKEAPLIFSKDIDYQDFNQSGDFKYIWEINRHQHLISLSKAYCISNNQAYKNEVKRQIIDWIKTNPYKKGINWISSLELSIRLISWSWAWFFLGNIDDTFKRIWLENIYKHCDYINKNFSRFSSANNHLIGEAAGLFIASVIWPFKDKSHKWRENSYKILIQEIEKQIFKDGVNKEQAISYQQFVMDFFILAGLLGEKNGIFFPKFYWKRIERMMEFIASIMDVRGNVPKIGDSDDGFAVILSDDKNFNPYRSLLATGAVIFKREDFKKKVQKFDEKSLWLLGIDGMKKFYSIEEKVFTSKRVFKNGGYCILLNNENNKNEIRSVFDCGPLGYLSLAAHGHADALSFTLNVGGKRFIVDPGTYVYQYPVKWRDYFKGTSAHNTIRIDGKNQSVIGGYYMWLKKARTKLIKWESCDKYDLVKAEHDGYIRLKDPVLHQRKIFFDKKKHFFRIIDKIESQKEHLIEQFFHFSEECELRKLDHAGWLITNGNKSLIIRVDSKSQTRIYKGSIEPILGWNSNNFDIKNEIYTMLNIINWKGSCELETLIIIKS